MFQILNELFQAGGIGSIIKVNLNDEEKEQFKKTAQLLKEVADGVKFDGGASGAPGGTTQKRPCKCPNT